MPDLSGETIDMIDWLRERLSYDAGTGFFTWKARPVSDFKQPGRQAWFNRELCGKRPGGVVSGYWVIFVTTPCGKRHRLSAHRIAMAFRDGEWPKNEIDHINRNRTDNRIENLRHATRSQNACNLPIQGVTSGFRGVYFDAALGKWAAQISIMEQTKNLGRFEREEDAAIAYDNAAWESRGEYAQLNFPHKGVQL